MNASQVLNTVVDPCSEIYWNESSPECSINEEDEVKNLPDPLSNRFLTVLLAY